MTWHLRRYRPDDRAACHQVFYRAVHEGAAAAYTAPQRAAWAPRPTHDPSTPDRLADQLAWLGEDAQGKVAGFMTLRPDGYLDMAFVLPEARGKGLAAELYTQILADATAQALPCLTAHASLLMRPFLAKRGWQVTEHQHHPQNGQTLERFAMTLPL